jgi:hypothetical protein
MFHELLGWRGDEPADEQLAQLERVLVLAGLKPAENIPLIAPLLNLAIAVKCPLLRFHPSSSARRLPARSAPDLV